MADEQTPEQSMDVGIIVSSGGETSAEERADVNRWIDTIKKTRKYDESAREQYARDRRYCRGDSAAEVDANIVGTNIDIMESFLYAKNPDVDVLPSAAVNLPGDDALRDAASEGVMELPEVQRAAAVARQLAEPAGEGGQAATIAADQVAQEIISQRVDAMRDRYQRRQRDNKAFAETLEITISKMWTDAGLKKRAIRWVRSGLSVGIGVLKASWQERTEPSAETSKAINDLQRMMQQTASTMRDLEGAEGSEAETKMADYKRQLSALEGQTQEVIARGFVIECTDPENFVVPMGYDIAEHLDAPWNAELIPMRVDDAKATFELTDEQIKPATNYHPRKPVMRKNEAAMVDTVDPSDASQFVEGESSGKDCWVMCYEIWDRSANAVLTAIEGVPGWVKRPWSPQATTRFYPYFLYLVAEVDGQRHPQSLVSRSAKLVDEYNRIGSAEAEHRRRVKPKTWFNAGMLSPKSAEKLESALTGEMVPIEPTQPNAPLNSLMQPVVYPMLDPALYSRERIINEINRIWGTQEALTGSVEVEKTATEAEIQQMGFQSRAGSRRDALEQSLTELAQYTAEIARANIDDEDIQTIAGPNALWPEYAGADDVVRMVSVEIRAGSSGKPNTSAERQAWATELPILQQLVSAVGQLRQSDPADVAESLVMLAEITAQRSGDRIDIEQLMPQQGSAQPALPQPGQPALPGPQGQPAQQGQPQNPQPPAPQPQGEAA